MNLSKSINTNLWCLSFFVFLVCIFNTTPIFAQVCPPTSNINMSFDWATNQMNVTWDAVPSATSYDVEITTNAGSTLSMNPLTNSTSAVMPAGTFYGEISVSANCGSEVSAKIILPYFLIVATETDVDIPPFVPIQNVVVPEKFCIIMANDYSTEPGMATTIHVTAHESIDCLEPMWYSGFRDQAGWFNNAVCNLPFGICELNEQQGSGGNVKGRLNQHLETAIKAYPNPNNGNLNIDFTIQNEGNVSIRLLDPTGKTMKQLISNQSFNIGQYLVSYSIEDLDAGFYILELETGETKQLIKMIKL